MKQEYFHKSGFTLAEVLVTLGVIGIVAAMTIPTLVQNYQEKVTVAKLKKFYSTLSQSYLFAVEKYGVPSQWDIPARNVGTTDEEGKTFLSSGGNLIKQRLFENMKVMNDCSDSRTLDKCYTSKVYYLSGQLNSEFTNTNGNQVAGTLADGSVFTVLPHNHTDYDNRGPGALSKVFGLINIDTNGKNPPNTAGKDLFLFYLTDLGIVPAGTKAESESALPFEKTCSQSATYAPGGGCTAWVLQFENMDYLHCDDLSWDGKHSCKE